MQGFEMNIHELFEHHYAEHNDTTIENVKNCRMSNGSYNNLPIARAFRMFKAGFEANNAAPMRILGYLTPKGVKSAGESRAAFFNATQTESKCVAVFVRECELSKEGGVMENKGLEWPSCSFCDVSGPEGNPWSSAAEGDSDGVIYRVCGCKSHKHLVDACVAAQALQPKRKQSNRYVPDPGSVRVRSGNALPADRSGQIGWVVIDEAPTEPPANCRQRLVREGKPYPRSSCTTCGKFSPKWRECDALLGK
jgi:hypothetical protein